MEVRLDHEAEQWFFCGKPGVDGAVARKRRQREQQLSKKAPLVLVSREGPFGNDYDFPVKYSSFAFFSFSSVVISFSNTLNMS